MQRRRTHWGRVTVCALHSVPFPNTGEQYPFFFEEKGPFNVTF